MKTEILKIDSLCTEQSVIVAASEKIKSGGLVAFPTETVYELGADTLNPVALSLIKDLQTPIAAPSANLFGRPSSTTAQHVFDDLNGRVDLILDAGKTSIGLESTILDLTQTPFCILRPGGVAIEQLKQIIPDVEVYRQNRILAPRMHFRHYSPKAKLILIEGNGKTQVDRVRELAADFHLQGYPFGIMAKEENVGKYKDFKVKNLGAGDNLTECAANLFSVLREFDIKGVSVILAEGVKEEGVGVAIMDRLRKAGGE